MSPRRRRPHETRVEPASSSVWQEDCRPAARMLLAGPLSPEQFSARIKAEIGRQANVMAWLELTGYAVYDMRRRLWRLTSGGRKFAEAAPKRTKKKRRREALEPERARLLLVMRRRLTMLAAGARICDECMEPHTRRRAKTCSIECSERAWRRRTVAAAAAQTAARAMIGPR